MVRLITWSPTALESGPYPCHMIAVTDELTIVEKLLPAYVLVAFLTLIFQIFVRSTLCSAEACALSYLKAVVWASIWPVSWPVYLAGLLV